MKKLSILGSTGSIGTNTLEVARHLKDEIEVVALAAGSNIELIEKQAKEFSPKIVALYDKEKAKELQSKLPQCEVLGGMEGLEAVASFNEANFVVSAITGTLGLAPTLAAINAGKDVGLANKEALVSGGELVIALAKEKGVQILPIDSEHSALFQALHGEKIEEVRRLILTASGGPFREFTKEQFKGITRETALRHPTWSMGPKVTIDSSTLMNKGLEVIEAYWLFGVPIEKIDVVVHPQSIIHSMVEYQDGSIMAQMGVTDMKIPIQYAITYPDRYPGMFDPFDFTKNNTLQFFSPDLENFRCLKLAFDAIKEGGTLPCYMNAANEVLVQSFLENKITWIDISSKLEELMLRHEKKSVDSLEAIQATDAQARREACEITQILA